MSATVAALGCPEAALMAALTLEGKASMPRWFTAGEEFPVEVDRG